MLPCVFVIKHYKSSIGHCFQSQMDDMRAYELHVYLTVSC